MGLKGEMMEIGMVGIMSYSSQKHRLSFSAKSFHLPSHP